MGAAALALAGCAAAPKVSRDQAISNTLWEMAASSEKSYDYASAAGNYNQISLRDPGNIEALVGVGRNLRYAGDPKEAIVDFKAGPKILYQRGTVLRGEQYGWGVCVWVNDRDKSGAYQGTYPMSFILRDDKIVHVNGGPDDGAIIGPNYARKQCEQLGAPPVPRD